MVLETSVARVLVGRLSEGVDLLNSLREVVKKYNVRSGIINLIGSLKKVRVGYYSRERGEYLSREADGFFELVSCMGNISWKDKEPIIHIHMAVSNKDGEILLGHVLDGNIVDATVEYVIIEFKDLIERGFDESTGLNLLLV